MSDVFSLLADLPLAIKFGWVLFAAWSTAQTVWFLRARVPAPVPVKAARKRRAGSSTRPPAVRTPRPQPAVDSGSDLLSSLSLQTSGASEYGVPMSGHNGPGIIS